MAMCCTSVKGPQLRNSAWLWSTPGLRGCPYGSVQLAIPSLLRGNLVEREEKEICAIICDDLQTAGLSMSPGACVND